eukprot:364671-Chlamydomonas_euryale.AAC.7
MMVTPLDVVKCNIQIAPEKYKNIGTGFGMIIREQGTAGLFKGWLPTLMGYSAQGAFKFGLYEYFVSASCVVRLVVGDMTVAELALVLQATPQPIAHKALLRVPMVPECRRRRMRTLQARRHSRKFFADIALCPFEAVKVKVQTVPGWARGLSDGMPKFIAEEGVGGLFKGLTPLWGRQIPYTMMKFGAFENTVVALYKHVIPKKKEDCSKVEQLGVSFLAGYIAGVFCAAVSHPADNLVSKLNANKSATVSDVVKDMGMWNLATRGLGLRIIMVGTLTGLQWGIYDGEHGTAC